MKYLLVLILFTHQVWAQELDLKSKKIIFDKIADYVFFEDEGYIRAPQKIEDFRFEIIDENLIQVTGSSYSDWDMKNLEYSCLVTTLTRTVIVSSADFSLDCSVENENWPHF